MNRILTSTVLAAGLLAAISPAQQPPHNGPKPVDAGWHALVNATAITRPGNTISNATIVIRNGSIQSITQGSTPPAGARVWDCTGLTVYAGFVEPYLSVDSPAPDANAPGAHWSPKITPQRHALDGQGLDDATREELRGIGFGAAALAPRGGIFRGTGAMVSTSERQEGEGSRVIRDRLYQTMAFDTGGGGYPRSEMGIMAAMRQGFHDADWYGQAQAAWANNPGLPQPEQADALQALIASQNLPLLFETQDELQLLRAAKIAQEFGRSAIVVGSGLEFRRIDPVVESGLPILVPVDFPDAPDVSTVERSESVSLRDLMTWEQAPTNPARLAARGVAIAFTTFGLSDRKDFIANVRKAVDHGLNEDKALAMLTTTPAEILGVEDRVGAIEAGKIANLVVVEGDLFDDGEIRGVWVEGNHHDVSRKQIDLDGTWNITTQLDTPVSARLVVDGTSLRLEKAGETAKASKVNRRERHLSFVVDGKILGLDGKVAMNFDAEASGLFGSGLTPDGTLFSWSALQDVASPTDAAATEETRRIAGPPLTDLALPFGAYGLSDIPTQEDLLLVGGTVWTSSNEHGVIENGALWIRGGRVAWVGSADNLPDVPGTTRRVDTSGKHITPGIIDCHSHTGIARGINEGSQSVTSEVRIADVLNPDDIAWYRELAGGLTVVNQLHGSANAIGGQNHVAKIRWGSKHPDDMSLQGAPQGIKFALGENPKRSENRYPDTRLGVAAIIRDRFVAAQEYAAEWARFEALDPRQRGSEIPPHRDLELDAVAEILRGERLVHSHSYRADEIFMLCRLADEFGFQLGTLQHVLEGYKVADAIGRSARGASTFSDWWGYKVEAYDAIPYNGAIMHDAGVVVSFNSDSGELARRLNTEAGKAYKYGKVPPAEALKFVTLNPAIQLGIEDRVGSLEIGKDGDFAIWSGDPLSYRSKCEATYIEGRAYFTLERDSQLRAEARSERQRLLQKALSAQGGSGGGRSNSNNRYYFTDIVYSCDAEEVNR